MGKRVDNIVIMGIGEPFDNYENVKESVIEWVSEINEACSSLKENGKAVFFTYYYNR